MSCGNLSSKQKLALRAKIMAMPVFADRTQGRAGSLALEIVEMIDQTIMENRQ